MSGSGLKGKIAAMAGHIESLCAWHGIDIRWHDSGLASPRAIYIRPVRSAVTYAVALHEIGHILGPWQNQGTMLGEAGAWIWARRNAIQWSPALERTMIRYLGSYVSWQKWNLDARLPARGHPSWSVLGVAGAKPPPGDRCRRRAPTARGLGSGRPRPGGSRTLADAGRCDMSNGAKQ